MTRFTHNDIVRLRKNGAGTQGQSGRAWVVAVLEDRNRYPLTHLPPGVVYTIEFEDGTAVDAHEDDLEIWRD